MAVATAAVFSCLLHAGLAPAIASAQGQPGQPGQPGQIVLRNPDVIGPAVPGRFDGDLRDLPRAPRWRTGDAEREVNPRRQNPRARPAAPPRGRPSRVPPLDPLFGAQMRFSSGAPDRAFSAPTLNFDGQGYTGVHPPDTVGDVGQTYYIQMINSSQGSNLVVYDKATGAIVAGPIVLDTLAPGGDCANGSGDPIVLYDELAGRWLLSEFTPQGGGNKLCVYVSQTGDPVSGGWFSYQFQAPSFPDYPKYAVWPDAYYVSSNEGSAAAYALDRTQMLAGNPATMQRFAAPPLSGFIFNALLPSDHDGDTPPPAGAPNYYMRHRDDEVHDVSSDPSSDFLEIWEFRVDFSNPANSTFSGPVVPVSNFDSDLCGLISFNCFPQPSGPTLDPLREVVMWRLQYRNFGTHETLVGNLATDVDGTDRGGIRWFELRKAGTGAWTLYQEGTHSPDAAHRWMGSIAMDGSGNIALGYSISSTALSPSIRYTGRLATDTLGAMPQGEHTIVNGTASNVSNRWGDYSSMNVDPVDDCTFWYTNEYSPSGNWATRIATFRFDSCTGSMAPPMRTLTVATTGPGSGTITSSPAGIACGSTCSESFASGTIVTLTPVADAGSYFAGFGGGPGCVDGSVTLTADESCTAAFGLGAPSPTPASDPGGPGVVDHNPDALDLDGDGLGDVVRYHASVGGAVSFLETGAPTLGAKAATASSTHMWSSGWTIKTGDFDGDGRTDLFFYDTATGTWFKGISTTPPGGPVTYAFSGGSWSPGWSVAVVELNGDGRADVFLYDTVSGSWFRGTSTGDGTGDFAYIGGTWSPDWQIHPVRLDADGLTDLFLYNVTTGSWFRAVNDGVSGFDFLAGTWSPGWQLTPGDYTGDGLTDLFLYDVVTGQWYVARNTGSDWTFVAGTFSPGWTPRAGDFDGDGLTDLFLYDVTTGQWFESLSDGAGGWTHFGGSWSPGWGITVTSIDADARADVLLYEPVGGAYFQGVNTGPGVFDYVGGNWGGGFTIIGTRP